MIKLLSRGKFYLFCVFVGLGNGDNLAFSQTARIDSQRSAVVPEIEKIHLHFDKPFYAVGDTIWFKAYLVNAANELTEHSKILYIDLISEFGFVLKSVKVPLLAGLGSADIPLDKGLSSGNYRVRAYTNWLRNFGDKQFFQKTIPVTDLFESQVAANISYSYSGGQLLADLHYKSLSGAPLADKEIRYTIPGQGKRAISGRGVTDVNGSFRVRIDTTGLGGPGSLITSLKGDTDTIFKSFSMPVNPSGFELSFFPEGGELVDGIPSRLGFKVVGSDGLGRKASGYIADESGSKVVFFDTEFAGMGMVGFNPQPGRKYVAYVSLQNGVEKQFLLPVAKEKGLVMTVSEDNNSLLVKIKTTPGFGTGSAIKLQAVSHDKTHVNFSSLLASDHLMFKILKSDLPTGIVCLTILSEAGLPLAERLVFVDHTDQLTISMDSLRDDYPLRSKVSTKIRVKDESGKPVLAHLSMSVIDESKVPYDETDEQTILSNLLLTSELKGYIEKPNYYFTGKDKDKRRQLDILMMTQGWRRFEWKEVNAVNKYPAESGLSLKGKVVSTLNSASPHAKISLLIEGQAGAFIDTIANEKGEFIFENLYFEEYKKLILNAKNNKGNSTVNIKLDPGSDIPKVKPLTAVAGDLLAGLERRMIANTDDDYLEYLKRNLDLAKTQLLSEVVVRAQRNRPPLNDRAIFSENKMSNSITLAGALANKVPGLMITNNQAYRLRDLAMGVPIDVFLDGAPMGPDLDIFNMHMHTVSYVSRMASTGRPGIVLGTGIPSLPATPPLGLAVFWLKGYAPERQFYSPVYAHPDADRLIPDHRSTIYWNPNILTINGENSDIIFYTAGKPVTYRFIIEGVDEYGRLGRTVLIKQIK